MIEIVEPTLAHVREVLADLRERDRAEMEGVGLKPRHVLHRLYRDALFKRAIVVDGATVAVWGVNGALGSSEGEPWIFATNKARSIPLTFFKVARREIGSLLEVKRRLATWCADDSLQSARFWRLVGFRVGDPVAPASNGTCYMPVSLERSWLIR